MLFLFLFFVRIIKMLIILQVTTITTIVVISLLRKSDCELAIVLHDLSSLNQSQIFT